MVNFSQLNNNKSLEINNITSKNNKNIVNNDSKNKMISTKEVLANVEKIKKRIKAKSCFNNFENNNSFINNIKVRSIENKCLSTSVKETIISDSNTADLYLEYKINSNTKSSDSNINTNSSNIDHRIIFNQSDNLNIKEKTNFDENIIYENLNESKSSSIISEDNSEEPDDSDIFFNATNAIYNSASSDTSVDSKGSTPHNYNSFKKYNLNLRLSPKHLCSSKKITHRLLPLKFKDNSKYKNQLIKYFKRKNKDILKTDSCKQKDFYKASCISRGNFRSIISKIKVNITIDNETIKSKYNANLQNLNSKLDNNNAYNKINFEMNKFDKHNSCSKVECINNLDIAFKSKHNKIKDKEIKEHLLKDYNSDKLLSFFKYNEHDIGFNKNWQRNLKITEMDDDVETDDDQLTAANKHIRKEVKEGVYFFLQSENKIRNSNRFKNICNKNNNIELNKSVKHKKCILFDFDRSCCY